MVRTLAVTAAVTAAVGFAVGWLAFSKTDQVGSAKAPVTTSMPTAPAPGVSPGEPRPDGAGVVAVIQRFALRAGDLSADRETPAVAVAPDGAVVLAWASQEKDGDNLRTLYVTRSTDGGGTFATPVAWRSVPIYRYTSGNPARERKMAFSTHVLPRLAATGDSVALGWVEAIDGGPTVQFLVARSHDGGKTFAAPVATHGENASRPGFTTLAADSDGGLACGWLSNQQPYFSYSPAGSAGFTPERLVFAGPEGKGICPCCDVAVTVTPERIALVAFRNSDSGHRDIWLARGGAGAAVGSTGEASFAAPIAVTQEPWTFSGCPHDGPSLALIGDKLHLAWMDAHTGTGRVYHTVGLVAEPRFEPHPRLLNPQAQGAQGHPKLVADSKAHLHAVWDEGLAPEPPAPAPADAKSGEQKHHHAAPAAGGAGRAIMYAVSRDGGVTFTSARALVPSPGVYQLQPSLTVGPDGSVFVTWNEIDQDGKHVVLARLAGTDQQQETRTP